MTRSELLQKAITLAKNGVEYESQHESTRELNSFALDLFLAEQKRSEGCEPCNHERIKLKMVELGFHYCPYCSRDLTEGESV